jgi:ketosteroid isomerase-like protein
MKFKAIRNITVGLLTFLCPVTAHAQHEDIHRFIDNWHRAAAEANAEAFFGAMHDDCIYIGTDATERWTKPEFSGFAKPYFDRKKAWDFKPYGRDIHVTPDGSLAWFSELLTTWMGVCRGSGVLVRTSNGWRITQYHLSVTVPNEIIGDFIKLIDESSSSPKK